MFGSKERAQFSFFTVFSQGKAFGQMLLDLKLKGLPDLKSLVDWETERKRRLMRVRGVGNRLMTALHNKKWKRKWRFKGHFTSTQTQTDHLWIMSERIFLGSSDCVQRKQDYNVQVSQYSPNSQISLGAACETWHRLQTKENIQETVQ